MAEWLGRTIGNYRIEDLLGAGGMGQVYRARHIHLEREVALKVLHTDFAQNANFVQRFRQEARAAAALRHPNIVEVYDFGEQDSTCYLAMELVTGGSLRGLLRRRNEPGNTEWDVFLGLTLVREAARALDFAHQHGVVHRDVKPDNILLLPQTGSSAVYSARLSDFGLARLAENSHLTATGVTMGTPAYISPEQCQGEEVDGRSDLYSLGIVLYEIATGLLPFAVKTLSDAVYKHVHITPPPPRSVSPTVSPELEAVILRCIAKSPDARFATGADLEAALGRVPEMQSASDTKDTVASHRSAQPGVQTEAAATNAATNSSAPQAISVLGTSLLPRVQALDAQGQLLGVQEIGGDGLTVGRLPSNNLLLDSGDVSRHHLRLDWDGAAVIITDLGSSNGSFLAGRRLTPQTPMRWNAQDVLQIGSFFLRLIPAATTNVAGATNIGNVLPANGGAIGVALESEHLSLMPGKTESLRITVANLGGQVEHLEVEVDGVPESWIKKPSKQTQLNPGTQATIPLGIEAPRNPSSKVGEYPVTIRIRSREMPERFGEVSGAWSVLPFEGAAITMTPLKNGGATQARYTLNLRNEGNADSRWDLKATDDEQALTYAFDRPQLSLAPGETSAVQMTVQADRRWIGTPLTRPFTVQMNTGGDAVASGSAAPLALTQNGQFVHRALLPPWLPPAALALLAAIPFAWKTLSAKPEPIATPLLSPVPTIAPSPTEAPLAQNNATPSPSASDPGSSSIVPTPAPAASITAKPTSAAPVVVATPKPTPTPRPDRSGDIADIQRVALGRFKVIRDRIQTARATLALVKDVPPLAVQPQREDRREYRGRYLARPRLGTQMVPLSEVEKATLAKKTPITIIAKHRIPLPRFSPRPHFSPIPLPVPSSTPPPLDMSAQEVASKRVSDLHTFLVQVWASVVGLGVGQAPSTTNFNMDDGGAIKGVPERVPDLGVPRFDSFGVKDLYSRLLTDRYMPAAEQHRQEQEFAELVSRYANPDLYPLAPMYPHISIYGAKPVSIGSPEYKTDMQQIEDWLNQVEQDITTAEGYFQ